MPSSKEAKEKYWKKKYDEAPEIECECGCGQTLKSVDKYARPVRFINGHNAKKYEGEDSSRWSAQKRYRVKHPDKYREYRRDYYRDRKLRAMRLLGNQCKHCEVVYDGKNAPIFEFHHIDSSEKENEVTRMLTNVSWEKTKEEMAKCMLLCSNCHRQFHGGEW